LIKTEKDDPMWKRLFGTEEMAPRMKTEIDADNRSVYVGNVDYGATADELEIHFNGCGPVNRVTILCDRFSGHPKGFAYIEFSDRESVESAIGLHETLFRGRVLKVLPKRTNMPGISTTDRGAHRGGQPRGRARGFRPPRYPSSSRGRFRIPKVKAEEIRRYMLTLLAQFH
uniref:RRM domain-containing protein n=1 Tax=Periophthalmus magnuspinnatus TaxID=409849 RepID=A0A3B4AIQ4_9GOBI